MMTSTNARTWGELGSPQSPLPLSSTTRLNKRPQKAKKRIIQEQSQRYGRDEKRQQVIMIKLTLAAFSNDSRLQR